MSRAVKIAENSKSIKLSIITWYDLNQFLVNVPQRHLVTIAHLKFWGYGAFYGTLFTVKKIMSTVFILIVRPSLSRVQHAD
jgi:hypothetical protein